MRVDALPRDPVEKRLIESSVPGLLRQASLHNEAVQDSWTALYFGFKHGSETFLADRFHRVESRHVGIEFGLPPPRGSSPGRRDSARPSAGILFLLHLFTPLLPRAMSGPPRPTPPPDRATNGPCS